MTESRGEIPTKIDRYEILEAVGYGAMGAVYKAFDPLIKRAVAVKTLRLDVPPDSPDYKAFLDRFATEARTAGRLSHPNIVTLYDVAPIDDQIPWLAMEYVEGQTVAELLAGERLPPEVVVGLVSQIASAIDYAHSEGVVHRDIKPSNVIVYGGEKVKVTDFGIAKLMDAEITHSGIMMGTPSYMSPEQAMGERVDGRTDIFSLGVVAFEMLSGTQPFPGNNVTSILYKLVHTDPVHPDDLEVLGLLPDKWRDVFSTALAKDPEQRFATAADFVKNLEQCLGSWFGALEGETVIMKDPMKLVDPEVPRDPVPVADVEATAVGATPIMPVDVSAAPVTPGEEAEAEDEDRTLIDAPPALADPVAEAVDPSEPSDLTVRQGDLDGPTVEIPIPAAVPSPVDDVETAIVEVGSPTSDAGSEEPPELDETVIDRSATPVPPSPPPAAVKAAKASPMGKPAVLATIGGLVLLLLGLVAFLLFGRGTPPPAPVVEPEPAPVVEDFGKLIVSSDPAGATVTVNGEESGETPLELEGLSFDTYELQVERDGFESEEVTAELTETEPEATIELDLRAVPPAAPQPALFRIRSVPEGASVSIDGTETGQTPTDAVRVRAGNRVVRLTLAGYLPWEDTVRARSGRTIDVDAELTALPSATEPEPASDPEPEPDAPSVEVGAMVERGDPGVVNPECISCPAVRYPEAARRTRQQGVVQLSFVIDENGTVQDIRVEESAGEIFDEAVVAGVRQWTYEPATKEGVRVKMRWVQRFRFRQGR